MGETISLQEIFGVIKKHLKMIISITLITALIAGVISYLVLTPIYQSSTQLLVNQKETQDSSIYQNNQVQTNIQLINTYNVIIKSPAILDDVIKELNLNYTVTELNKKITVAGEKDSQVFTVMVQDSSPKKAQAIANTIAGVFQQKIGKIMSVNNVSILAKAELSDHPIPVKPNPKLNIIIAIFVGALIGVGLAFLLDYFDNTVKTEKDLEELIGLPVLGVITTISELNDTKRRVG